MSDFIFSSQQKEPGVLAGLLGSIHIVNPPKCNEFHGSWGSLAVFNNHYNGYNHFEDTQYLIIVIGAPVVKFSVNKEPKSNNRFSKAILKRWKYKKEIRWDSDLSGPFAILCIDKINNQVEAVTDLLLFIPIYYTTLKNSKDKVYILGTHNDVTAKAAGRDSDIDFTSATDMLLNSSIVFPYTFHENVVQLLPATIYNYELNYPEENALARTYWIPAEQYIFKNINEAAFCLRESLLTSIEQITDGLSEVGLFLTGGEDTRVILSAIPENIKKDAFIFLDSLNREGEIAQHVARIYNTKLQAALRSDTYYLENMKAACALLGSQFNYTQLHTYKFHTSCSLRHYPAVLGGFAADGLIKGDEIPVKTFKAGKHILFSSLQHDSTNNSSCFNPAIFSNIRVEEVNERRHSLSYLVRTFRTESFNEWKNFWPITNKEFHANFLGNRRLFRSFEPILNTNTIKILASVPQQWKLNRRLFHKAFKPLLKKTWYIPHNEKCHFPYFGITANIPLKLFEAVHRKLTRNKYTGNQGPWSGWDKVIETRLMQTLLLKYSDSFENFNRIFKFNDPQDLFKGTSLNPKQKLMLLQLLYLKSSDVLQPV